MKALVTGGGGFLGNAIVQKLLKEGHEVRSLTRRDYPALRKQGVDVHQGDLADLNTVLNATEGCDLVFHVAALAGVWGPYEDYYNANVKGTENILEGCKKHGIPRLIYTSTPSVVHSGGDVEGVDESAPYATHFETHYPKTKAIAERMVLEHNHDTFSTIALRPHLIWGPGDNHLIPRIIQRARAKRLRLIDGGTKLIDSVYVDNAAKAHLLAMEHLKPGAACAGKAYFITQGEPIPTRELINRILNAAGLPPTTKSVSFKTAYRVGGLLEKGFKLFNAKKEPPMTRFVAQQLSTAHWYDISAARRDLHYTPEVSLSEGLEKLAAHFKTHGLP